MKFKLSKYEKLLYLFLDLVMLNIATLAGFYFRFENFDKLWDPKYQVLLIFINLGWLLLAVLVKDQVENRRARTRRILWDFLKVWVLAILLTLSFASAIKGDYSRGFVLANYAAFLFLGGVSRALFNQYLKGYRRRGYNYRRIIVVGVNSFSIDFVHEVIQHSEYGYKFMGFFDTNTNDEFDIGRVGMLEDAYKFLLEFEIDEVYISLPNFSDYQVKSLLKFCHLNYIKVNFLNEFINLLNKKSVQVEIDYNGPTPIVSVLKEPLEVTTNKFLKRFFDVVFSSLILVFVMSWLYPLIAISILIDSKGPIIFKQKRSGIDATVFDCYKFRTMVVNKGANRLQAKTGDERITKFGQFLRKYNLDELPQFWNVLKGDMSVVGPRPHMLEHTRIYSKIITPFMVRHWVKPGITGLAQAKGYRGETKEVSQMYGRVKMDVFYIQNWSLFLDFRIVILTIWNMITLQKTGV